MKGKKIRLVCTAVLTVMVFALSACPPPFFTHTDTDSPVLMGNNATGFGKGGPLQRTQLNGVLNLGAGKTDTDFCVYSDFGNYDPYIWDGDSSIYRDISATSANDVAALFRKSVEISPDPQGTETWTLYGGTTNQPYFCVDASDFYDFPARTIMEVKINHELDGNDVFKASGGQGPFYMAEPRYFYVRTAGTSTTAPHIVSTNIVEGATVALDFEPQITFSKELGQVIVGMGSLVDGDTSGDPLQFTQDVVNLIASGTPTGTGTNVNYKFVHLEDLEPNSTYHIGIAVSVTDGWSLGYVKSGMKLTQDFDGNVVDGDSSGVFGDLIDVGQILTGDTLGLLVYETYVVTGSE